MIAPGTTTGMRKLEAREGEELLKTEAPVERAARIERLLTMRDVADRLQISPVTAWRLHAERGLRVIKIGRAVRVRESDLETWLEKHAKQNGESVEVAP